MRPRGAPITPVVGPRVGTNRFALASLALGLCGGAPLGLVFGLIALAQIRQSAERGRVLAVFGIVCSVVWLVALAVRAAVR
jgi:hypothetical protein